jgi:hypothetical protein
VWVLSVLFSFSRSSELLYKTKTQELFKIAPPIETYKIYFITTTVTTLLCVLHLHAKRKVSFYSVVVIIKSTTAVTKKYKKW